MDRLDTTGILGGTFDPIHLGHLEMAEAVVREMGVRKMLFIPDGDPPHKGELADGRDRMNMVRLAIEGHTGFEANEAELNRPGVTYTVETLKELTLRAPRTRWLYVVGSDTLMVIETWRNFPEVAKLLSAIAVVPRPGDRRETVLSTAQRISAQYGVMVKVLDKPVSRISSTEVRYRAARHQALDGLVPPAVAHYIRAHKLYRQPMLEELRRTMTPARYKHTLGVEEMAIALAKKNGLDVRKAQLAALLHDGAKHMPMDEMVELVKDADAQTAPGEDESRALLHAAAGMVLAKEKFGVDDPEVLSAIRWHTTGRAGMTALDKVIYLADMIEPGRRFFPGLDLIREAAERDLDEAMAIAARRTVDYVRSRGMPLNERTLELLGSIEQQQRKKESAT
ncbi:MAG: nicotinate-nucleotide adenylyltransferase [Clostridia bacterium]